MVTRLIGSSLFAILLAGVWQCGQATAVEGHWKRTISYQNKSDLFYNNQVGPCPSGTAAQMYVAPLPVPANVGHTYTTYQPLMPQEFLNRHTRSHYAYQKGAGWSRAKVRYRTRGLIWQDIVHNISSRF